LASPKYPTTRIKKNMPIYKRKLKEIAFKIDTVRNGKFQALGSRFEVRGLRSRFEVRGSRFEVRGSRAMSPKNLTPSHLKLSRTMNPKNLTRSHLKPFSLGV
jgi:hypothetical protein